MQTVRAQPLRERHRLPRPFPPCAVRVRNLRVVVARPTGKGDPEMRPAPQAAVIAMRVREHRARDRLVAGEATGEEVRAVGVAVVRRLAEVEDHDPADAALRRAARAGARSIGAIEALEDVVCLLLGHAGSSARATSTRSAGSAVSP